MVEVLGELLVPLPPAAQELNRPVMIQFSEGGAAFAPWPEERRAEASPKHRRSGEVAGKSLPNEKGKLQASLLATRDLRHERFRVLLLFFFFLLLLFFFFLLLLL